MRRVAIVYHFFAHYRRGIIKELLTKSAFKYTFVGDMKDPNKRGIKSIENIPAEHFLYTPCFKVRSALVQLGLIRLAIRKDIDVIIFLGDPHYVMTWVSALLARVFKKRVLYWTHGWTRDERNIKDFIRRLFYSIAHGLLLYGNHARNLALARGFRPEKLYVIGNSLDYEAQKAARSHVSQDMFTNVRKKLFEFPHRPLLICSCRLQYRKRLDLLMDAMDVLENDGIRTNLLLIGSGPDRCRLERIAREKNLSVNFFGSCYEEDKLAVLTMAADLTVSPGEIGLTAILSMTYGTPVVTHDDVENQGPEFESIIPGNTGDFFSRDDSADLAEVIKRWVTSLKSPEMIESACMEMVDKYYNPGVQRIIIEQAVNDLCQGVIDE